MKTNRKMERIDIIFIVAILFMAGAIVILSLEYAFLKKRYNEAIKVTPPRTETLHYGEDNTTHIVSREEVEPDKYIVVTSNGAYRVPENFSLWHSGELIYIENIETGERNYAYKFRCYENEIKDLSHE